MQPVRLADLDAGVLVLDTEQEPGVATQPEHLRHARVRTVRPHDETRRPSIAEIETALRPLCGDERRLMSNGRPGLHSPVGEPAHQLGRVGGEEVVTGRRQVNVMKAGRIQPHALNPSDELRGEAIEQCDLIDGILDDNPCGVELLADVGLALEHRHAHAGSRQRGGARQPGEAGADDDAITLRRLNGDHAVGRKYSTIPAPIETSANPAYISGLMAAFGG